MVLDNSLDVPEIDLVCHMGLFVWMGIHVQPNSRQFRGTGGRD